jgi:hypothetical protein
MNFNTPQDKITKDMFMDYQKTEQQKHYDDGTNKFQYDPTGLFDPTGTATISFYIYLRLYLTTQLVHQKLQNKM